MIDDLAHAPSLKQHMLLGPQLVTRPAQLLLDLKHRSSRTAVLHTRIPIAHHANA